MGKKIVQVPGLGNVEFPDGMTDEAMAELIQLHLAGPWAGKENPWTDAVRTIANGPYTDPKATNLYDLAGNNLDGQGPTVYSRFTRQPAKIYNNFAQPRAIDPAFESTGETIQYRDGTSDEKVRLSGDPSWASLQNTLHHEDVHALMNTFEGPALPDSPKVMQAWSKAKPLGAVNAELPAYMVAFKEGQIPGITKADRDQWLQQWAAQIPGAQREKVMRMAAGSDASQIGTLPQMSNLQGAGSPIKRRPATDQYEDPTIEQ